LFIDKVAASFKLQKKPGQYPATPLNKGYFALSEEELNAARTKEIQSLTGSLVFISCITDQTLQKLTQCLHSIFNIQGRSIRLWGSDGFVIMAMC
jgi:hypothetical protein